jgi:hypothetical protein
MSPTDTAVSASASSRHVAISVGASIVAGLALWVSRGSLDVAGTAQAPERVAMLPAWSQLIGLIMLALLITSAIAALLQRRAADPAHEPFWSATLSDTLLPFFGLSFVILPYLPYLADWVPALRILAGPIRAVIWAIVVGQVLWLLLPRVFAWRRATPLVFGILTFAASALLFSQLATTPHFSEAELAQAGYAPVVVWALIGIGAATGAVIWGWARAATGSAAAAAAAWAAVCLSPPFALNTLAVFPEGPLALGVVVVAAVAWRFRQRMAPAMFYALAIAVSLATWGFLTRGDLSRFDAGALPVGVAGLLLDQEYGIVAYAPALLLGIAGLALMLREPAERPTAVFIALVVIPFLALAACIDPWWSKSAMPGRLILPVFPLLALPLASWYQRSGDRPVTRGAIQLMVLVGVALTITLGSAVESVPMPQEADGSSSILQWMSQAWPLWADAPSFVAAERPVAAARALLWLGALGLFAWISRGGRRLPAGQAMLRAGVYAAAIWIATVSVSGAIPGDAREGPYDPQARVIFPMLETFDPVARPIAVRYDPLSFVTPQTLPPLFSLTAAPGQRRDRQPVRVVLNARFRLPAGEYLLDLTGADNAGGLANPTVALQLGRDGNPVETWPLTLAAGGQWQRRFQVPLDSQFVGFRASRQVERAIAGMRVTPVNVVETRRRFRAPVVRAAASYVSASVFFHDAEAYPEHDGFWVKGRSETQVTIAKKVPASPSVTLVIHSGSRASVVTLSTGRWTEHAELVPGVTTRVSVPSDATEQFIPLTISTSDGFVPAETERGNRDRRLLGAWVSFSPDDISRTSGAP